MLVVICTGGGIWAWNATADLRAIGDLPESERPRAISNIVRKTLGDTDRPLLDLQAAVADGRDDDAWALTSDGLRASTPRADFDKFATLIRTHLGRPVEILVLTANFRQMAGFGDAASGSTVDLTYQADFEKGKGTITATLLKDAAGTWRVHVWRVQSPAFLDPLAAPAAPEPAPAPERDAPK
ncbi:MAG: hypothetical protein K8T90_04355 [Planctomycetes bacterium]|nr:hypothetical protein [Planctomycetota bacterium]